MMANKTIERLERAGLNQQAPEVCPKELRANPFYGKKYIVIGRIPIEDYSYKFEEKYNYLGAEKRKELSSMVDYVFVADKPGTKTLQMIEKFQNKGIEIKLIPYFKAVEIANETNRFMVFNDINKSQDLIQKINDILANINKTCDTSSLGLNLNDRYYEERLKREEERLEYEKSEIKKTIITGIILIVILTITWIFNLWVIFLIIGVFCAFPKLTGKMTGSLIKSLLK